MFKYFDAAPKSKGQGLLEYAILIVLIAGVAYGLVGTFTTRVNTLYSSVTFSNPGSGTTNPPAWTPPNSWGAGGADNIKDNLGNWWSWHTTSTNSNNNAQHAQGQYELGYFTDHHPQDDD